MSEVGFAIAVQVVGAEKFMQAKIIEFEAACYGGSKARCNAAEENCRTALQALLDLKAEQAVFVMKNARG